jgi:hypothetical protein
MRSRRPAHFSRFAVLFLVILALAVSFSRGQDSAKKHYLTFQIGYRGSAGQSGVSYEVNNEFRGRVEVRPTEAYDLPQSAAAQMKLAEVMQAAVQAGDADKLTKATPPLLVTWFPVQDQVKTTVVISEIHTWSGSWTAEGEGRAGSVNGIETYKAQTVCQSYGGVTVKIHPEEKTYDLQFSLMPDMATTMEAVHQTRVVDHQEEGHNTHEASEAQVPLQGLGESLGYENYRMVAEVKGLPLAGDAGELIGNTRIPVPKPANWNGEWDIALEVSWQIDVSLPPVELVITIPGYDEWRPEGNIKEVTKLGNNLVARATVQVKEGQGTFIPRVKNIRFQLLDTSREPGVCMNWPLNAKDTDYDLRLAAVSGGTLSKSDQKLEVTDPHKNDAGQYYAETQIDSYDFGGKGSLQAICLLNDGREIEGVMKDVGAVPHLPKRKTQSWIADSWRKTHHVEDLPDDDDSEKVEGQKDNGDGFTLYEEYRGWVENGKHIEGDPKKKDLFVLNLIGADAKGGIALFGRLSKLRVHSKLQDPKEISKTERLMNGNHRDGPHRVDQHGVIITNRGSTADGAVTAGTADAAPYHAFRPRFVSFVHVESRQPNGVFAAKASAEYNLSERDAQFIYDRAVAHELLHAVGVDHHGEVPWHLVRCYFQGASAPLNPTHHARFTTGFNYHTSQIDVPGEFHENRGDTITLLWEDTQRDVVEDSIAAYEAELAQHQADNRTESYLVETAATAARLSALGIKKDASFWADYDADNLASMDQTRGIRVGREGGTDSGNELCVMKYYFADAYEIKGRENAYYLIRPGSTRAGREICTSPTGTGVNAQSHEPQSRFGDAHSGRGNCFGDICPNDAIPPRSTAYK